MSKDGNETAKPLSERLLKCLVAMRDRFRPKAELGEVENRAHLEMLRDLAQRVGIDRLEVGVRKAITECEFWPTKMQLEQLIPPADGKPARLRCGLCASTEGWQRGRVTRYLGGEAKEYDALKRCDHAGQRTFREDQVDHDSKVTPREAAEVLAGLPENLQDTLASIFRDKAMEKTA